MISRPTNNFKLLRSPALRYWHAQPSGGFESVWTSHRPCARDALTRRPLARITSLRDSQSHLEQRYRND